MKQAKFNELANEDGQISFADAVFFDEEMALDQKRFWLGESAKLDPKQIARLDWIERREQKKRNLGVLGMIILVAVVAFAFGFCVASAMAAQIVAEGAK